MSREGCSGHVVDAFWWQLLCWQLLVYTSHKHDIGFQDRSKKLIYKIKKIEDIWTRSLKYQRNDLTIVYWSTAQSKKYIGSNRTVISKQSGPKNASNLPQFHSLFRCTKKKEDSWNSLGREAWSGIEWKLLSIGLWILRSFDVNYNDFCFQSYFLHPLKLLRTVFEFKA